MKLAPRGGGKSRRFPWNALLPQSTSTRLANANRIRPLGWNADQRAPALGPDWYKIYAVDIYGSGALVAQPATMAGSGQSGSSGSGVLVADYAIISGAGTVSGGGGTGSTVTFFRGVSVAGGVAFHKGVSQPTVTLVDLGDGTFSVIKTHELSGELNPSIVSVETYKIDGDLP